MAIKFDKIVPGMRLLDIHTYQASNAHMRVIGCWDVLIVSVDREKRTASVRWNGNPPMTWDRRRLERLYTKVPPKHRERLAWVRDPDNSALMAGGK